MQHALQSMAPLHIIQIGANDGLRLDPVRSIIEQYDCRALLVEPVPYIFEKLKANYAGFVQVKLLQCAVVDHTTQDTLPFYCFLPKPDFPFNPDFSLWGSFDEGHLDKFRHSVPHFDDLKACIEVPVMAINKLINQAGFPALDILQMDAEGWDVRLLGALDVQRWQPALICFEHLHAPKAEVRALLQKMQASHYATYSLGMDTVMVHPRWQQYFKTLRLVKLLHSNWLLPAR